MPERTVPNDSDYGAQCHFDVIPVYFHNTSVSVRFARLTEEKKNTILLLEKKKKKKKKTLFDARRGGGGIRFSRHYYVLPFEGLQ